MRQNGLIDKAQYYSANLNHEKWYMLVYGEYANAVQARAAIPQLPAALRARHPWVKSYRIVHDEIRLRLIVT